MYKRTSFHLKLRSNITTKNKQKLFRINKKDHGSVVSKLNFNQKRAKINLKKISFSDGMLYFYIVKSVLNGLHLL